MQELNEKIDFKAFPTTRYQGSKRKILPWIYDTIKELRFDTVLDACGGTASVSYLFKKMGKKVTYNDKLNFNYLIGKALIENQRYKLTKQDLENIKLIKDKCLNKKIVLNDSYVIRIALGLTVQLSEDDLINASMRTPKILTGRPKGT